MTSTLTTDTKPCTQCPGLCHRRANEWPYRWRCRKFCSHACAAEAQRQDPRLRKTQRRDDLMAEWDWLRRDGHTRRQAAERLGMSFTAFDRQYWRARKAGDPRAVDPARGQR